MGAIHWLRTLPLGIRTLTIYICCERGCYLEFLEVEEPSEWEEIRSRLSRLSNLVGLNFVVQHSEDYVTNPKRVDYGVFKARLKAIFEQELSSLHEQGILSISSSVVSKLGSQDW